MKYVLSSVALSVFVTTASAASLTVENDTINVSGEFTWTAGEGDVDPVRGSTTYTFELPLTGTPFDAEFTPPAGAPQQVPHTIGHGLPVSIGDPQTCDTQREGEVTAYLFNWQGPRVPVLRPDDTAIEPQPVLTDQYIGLGGLLYVSDGADGANNVGYMNFFLNFNEDYSQLLSISATQVVESSTFAPHPDGETVSELGILVALAVDEFDPISTADVRHRK
ncbi:hypothetical protein [Roseobacter sinensis]|uniref:PEP-CTERM sorting domain-containing protein n=1 Tax=Roseobacter sinensis TaxID=2931391 RepID=A0ABT3BCF3_9RHOB|nr:hypothetical protein [Roseobacter sp. WL0113]MCV3271240.1 hypothetical protein [Roseobacter sp. WL0113]